MGDPPNLNRGPGQPAASPSPLNTPSMPYSRTPTTHTFTQAHKCAHARTQLPTCKAHTCALTYPPKHTEPPPARAEGASAPTGREVLAPQNLFSCSGPSELPSQTLFPKPASNLTHFSFKTRKHQQTRRRGTDGNNHRREKAEPLPQRGQADILSCGGAWSPGHCRVTWVQAPASSRCGSPASTGGAQGL